MINAGITSLVVYHLLMMHLPGGRPIYINPGEVVILREPPHPKQGYVHEDTMCVVQTTDGKNTNVIETCEQIRKQIEEIKQNGNK
jgi:hypothetical protein